jgi:hypothetical protein
MPWAAPAAIPARFLAKLGTSPFSARKVGLDFSLHGHFRFGRGEGYFVLATERWLSLGLQPFVRPPGEGRFPPNRDVPSTVRDDRLTSKAIKPIGF